MVIERLEDIHSSTDRELVEFLQNLIRIPSWVSDEEHLKSMQNENGVVDLLEEWIKNHTNLDITRQSLDQGRFNLIATKGKPNLVFLAHTDTVAPSQNAQYDQLAAEIHDGKVWGRGATDMKSGIATVLQALSLTPEANNVWILLYADEEYDFLGMKALIRDYSDVRPRFIVSADGADLRIGHGCRGLMEARFRIKGQTGHAAKGNGLNAIDGAFMTLQGTRRYLNKFIHPIMGSTSMNVAYLFGGTELPGGTSYSSAGELVKVGQEGNVIPDLAEFIIDVRPSSADLNIGELTDEMRRLSAVAGYGLEVISVRHDLGAWYTDVSEIEPLVDIAREVLEREVEFEDPGRSGYLDLQMLWEATGRPPAMMFGGGVGATAHTSNEHISIENLIQERNFFKALLDRNSL